MSDLDDLVLFEMGCPNCGGFESQAFPASTVSGTDETPLRCPLCGAMHTAFSSPLVRWHADARQFRIEFAVPVQGSERDVETALLGVSDRIINDCVCSCGASLDMVGCEPSIEDSTARFVGDFACPDCVDPSPKAVVQIASAVRTIRASVTR